MCKSEYRQRVSGPGCMLDSMLPDDACYSALSSRDARFDGWFVVGVRTTGIYCRPSCPAITPKRRNVRFFPTAAAAQGCGFRACKRCRPDAVPGSPEWNVRADLVGRAMRHIADGVVDREGVAGLARRLGYTERHVYRQLVAELGAGPIALARAQRAQTARILLETTDVAIADIAFAAGFASVRQFNDTIRAVFAVTPTQLRSTRRDRRHDDAASHAAGDGHSVRDGLAAGSPGGRSRRAAIALRLPFRPPLAAMPLFEFLAARAVGEIEAATTETYRRTLSLAHGPALIKLTAPSSGQTWVSCLITLSDLRDLASAVARCRRLFDLDADAPAIHDWLAADAVLGGLVRGCAGLRSPGHVDGFEVAVRAIIGQQVSVRGARTTLGRLVRNFGSRVEISQPDGTGELGAGTALTHTFPSADALADADPVSFGMPRARGAAIVALARGVADGEIDLGPGADRDETSARLLALPGVGPWTDAYIRMRALGDPDVFLAGDLGVRRGVQALGQPHDVAAVERLAARWQPWRSYAVHYAWAAAAAQPARVATPTSSRRAARSREAALVKEISA